MLARIATEAAERFSNRIVVDGPDGRLSYLQLDRFARLMSVSLRSLGVAEGDVVALVLPSGADWLVAAVAVSHVGAVFAGVSPVLTSSERAAQQRLIKPRLTIATPDLIDGLSLRSDVAVMTPGGRGAEIGDVGSRSDAGPDTDAGPGGDEDADDERYALPEPDDDRAAVICFTSGTTGVAKAALFLERQLNGIQAIDLGDDFDTMWGGGSPMLASTQFAHVGMSTKFPVYLRRGATLHVMARWRADEALRLIAEQRMPTIGVVAPQLALMLRSPLMDQLQLGCVNNVIAGGAVSPVSLIREARNRLGAGYSIRYSSTESGGVGLGTAFECEDEQEWATVGFPRSKVEARIADDGDNPVSVGDIGELQLRSPAVMNSYWNDPAATSSALTTDGWLRTGDLACFDDVGRVELSGRRTDMYIRGGYNVFPSEVESVLAAHPLVEDIVVVGWPDDVMGETGLALVVATDPDHPPTVADLRTFGSTGLAAHKLPSQVVLVDEVPLTSAQKVDRTAALAKAESVLL